MTLLQVFILAVVQGLTEFLPISSSGHLVLLHEYLHSGADEALALDVAVHLGSMVAIILFFRREVASAFSGLGDLAKGRRDAAGAGLALGLIIATIPALIVGFIFAITGWIDALRSTAVIGWTMLIFGLFLYWAHRSFPETRHREEWSLKDAVIMGLWQVLSLVPGVSRAGITVTAARMRGFERHDAARIAMLMSIPITLSTAGYLLIKLSRAEMTTGLLVNIGFGAMFSFFAAWISIGIMMRFLKAASFTPYVIYRVLLGLALLFIAYS